MASRDLPVIQLVAVVAAGGALAIGAAAFAQDAQKPQQPKAEAKQHQQRLVKGV
jgi:hypothetical protein